jgi:hypothetical protein
MLFFKSGYQSNYTYNESFAKIKYETISDLIKDINNSTIDNKIEINKLLTSLEEKIKSLEENNTYETRTEIIGIIDQINTEVDKIND